MGVEQGTIRIDKFLTGLAQEYAVRNFSWTNLFPPIIVEAESGKIKVTNKAGYWKAAPKRASGAPAELGTGSYTKKNYSCEEYAMKEFIEDKDVSRAAPIFNLKKDAMTRLNNRLGLAMEIAAMTEATQTSGGISSSSPDHIVTPSSTWDNRTSSTPLEDIAKGKRMIADAIGEYPNTIFMSTEVAEKLSVHPEVIENYKYAGDGRILESGELPPRIKGMRVVVSSSIYNSADEGQAVTFANIWRRHCLLAYVNPASLVNFGRMLIWRATNMETRTWRNEEVRGTYIEVACSFDPKIITTDAAYWFQNVIA